MVVDGECEGENGNGNGNGNGTQTTFKKTFYKLKKELFICAGCTRITGLKVGMESCVYYCHGGYYCADQQACKARIQAPLPKRRAPAH